jgi:hypothetical protein
LCSSYTALEIFKLLSEGHGRGFICGAGTAGLGNDEVLTVIGLSESHAYALLGAFELKNDQTGEVEHRLYLLQNPWRFEQYIGPWHDKDPRWTASYKK